MTENDYIKITDLAKIRDIQSILRNICHEANNDINQSEYETIGRILFAWENRISDNIKPWRIK